MGINMGDPVFEVDDVVVKPGYGNCLVWVSINNYDGLVMISTSEAREIAKALIHVADLIDSTEDG